MRVIPVENLVVEVTAEQVQQRGDTRWRGHWLVRPGQMYRQNDAVAEGDTDLYVTEEHAYLFASTEGVATAKDIVAKFPGH
jgi:hypothetical protein